MNTTSAAQKQTKKLEPSRLTADTRYDFKPGEFVIYHAPTNIKYSAQIIRFYGHSVEIKIYKR